MSFSVLWNEHPEWSLVFSDEDFVLVDALERLAGPQLLTARAAVAALLLAKSVRLNHVALSLKEDELDRLIHDQLWVTTGEDGEEEVADAPTTSQVREGIDDLCALSGVAERLSLRDPVTIVGTPLVVSDETYIAYRRYAYAEDVVTQALLRAALSPTPIGGMSAPEAVTLVADMELSAEGRAGLTNALERSFSVLTGGPGRGKTTIIAALLICLKRYAMAHGRTFSVALCAPTAKAAVRMQEALNQQLEARGETLEELNQFVSFDEKSGSVHRLLGIRPDNTKSLRTLNHDLVIVDEVSMLDFTLLAKLLQHTPKANLLLVGDADQLASVNVGAALRDIIDGAVAATLDALVTKLHTNYRSVPQIDELASAINNGNFNDVLEVIASNPLVLQRFRSANDAFGEVMAWSRDLRHNAAERNDEAALSLLGDNVVLCATHRGEGSVDWWREAISRQLLTEETPTPTRFQVGTPVLVKKNEQSVILSIDQRLSNGDVGIARLGDQGMEVVFGPRGQLRVRAEAELGDAEAAWSMTIHKSQGSEYKHVVVSLPNGTSRTLTKELLYTAVTRAKESLTIIGSDDALRLAVERVTFRASGLIDRLLAQV